MDTGKLVGNGDEQKLVGYIIYDIWTYKHKGKEENEWKTEAIIPEVHWKKKIYLTLSRAEEAAKHMKERNGYDSEQIIIPVFSNREDLNRIEEGYKKLKSRIK